MLFYGHILRFCILTIHCPLSFVMCRVEWIIEAIIHLLSTLSTHFVFDIAKDLIKHVFNACI